MSDGVVICLVAGDNGNGPSGVGSTGRGLTHRLATDEKGACSMVEQPPPPCDTSADLSRRAWPPPMLALFEHLQRRLPDIDERHGIEACEFVSHGLRYHWLVDGQCLTCRTVWPCDEFLIRTRMGASLLGLAS